MHELSKIHTFVRASNKQELPYWLGIRAIQMILFGDFSNFGCKLMYSGLKVLILVMKWMFYRIFVSLKLLLLFCQNFTCRRLNLFVKPIKFIRLDCAKLVKVVNQKLLSGLMARFGPSMLIFCLTYRRPILHRLYLRCHLVLSSWSCHQLKVFKVSWQTSHPKFGVVFVISC